MATPIGEIEAVLKLKDEASEMFSRIWRQMSQDATTGGASLGKALSDAVGGFGELATAIQEGPIQAFKAAVDTVENTISVLAQAVEHNFTGIVGLVAGLGAAFVGLGAYIVEMGEKGSALSDINDRFTLLAGGSKAAAEDMAALSEATFHTVDSFELQKAMLPALSSGLKLTASDYKLIGNAAMDMAATGRTDAVGAINEITRALASGQARHLSYLGVIVDQRKAMLDLTTATGMAAGAVMGAAKVHEMDAEILKGLKTYVEQNGLAQETFANRVEAAKNFLSNYSEELGIAIARSPVVAAAADSIGKAFMTAFGNDQKTQISVMMYYVEQFAMMTISMAKGVVDAVKFMGDAYYGLRVVFDWLVSSSAGVVVDVLELWNKLSDGVGAALGKLVEWASRAQGVSADTARALGKAVEDQVKSNDRFSQSTIASARAVSDGYKTDMDIAVGSLKKFDAGMDGTRKVLDQTYDSMQHAADGIHNIGKVAAEDPLALEVAQITKQLATLNNEITRAAKNVDFTTMVKDFGSAASAAAEKAKDLGVKVPPAIAKMSEAFKEGWETAKAANEDANIKIAATIQHLVDEHVPLNDIVAQWGQQALAAAADAHVYQNSVKSVTQEVARLYAEFQMMQNTHAGLTEAFGNVVDFKAQAQDLIALGDAQNKYFDEVQKDSESTAAYQIDQIDKAARAQIAAFHASKDENQRYAEYVNGLADRQVQNLYEDLQAENDNTQEALQFQADRAEATYQAMAADPEEYSAATIQHFKDIAMAAQNSADGVKLSFHDAFAQLLDQIPALLQQAFTGGGGIAGALKAIGSMSGELLGKSIASSLGEAGSPLEHFMTTDLGKMFGDALPVIGSVIGPLVSGLFTKLFGTAGRDAVKAFAASFADAGADNGFANLQQQLTALGAAGQALWVKLTQGTGRNNADQAKQNIQAVQDALAKLNSDVSKYNLHISDMVAGTQQAAFAFQNETKSIADTVKELTDAGYSQDAITKGMAADLNQMIADSIATGQKIPANLQPILDKLAQMGLLTQENAAALLGLSTIKLDGGSYDDIMAAAQRYGLTLDSLGAKVNQININQTAQQLSADWKLLTSDGEDVNAVMTAMAPKVQNVVTQALKFGDEIPDSMKPMIDAMIQAGLLTDQFGNKLTDDSKINFSKDLTQQVGDLVTAINKLVDALTGNGDKSLAGSLRSIGNTTVHSKIVVDTDWSSFTNGPNTNKYHLPEPSPEPHVWTGGLVVPGGVRHLFGGGPAGDTVPAMLTPGEIVLNAAQQRNIADAMATGGGGDVYVYIGNEQLDNRTYKVSKKAAQKGKVRTRAATGRTY